MAALLARVHAVETPGCMGGMHGAKLRKLYCVYEGAPHFCVMSACQCLKRLPRALRLRRQPPSQRLHVTPRIEPQDGALTPGGH